MTLIGDSDVLRAQLLQAAFTLAQEEPNWQEVRDACPCPGWDVFWAEHVSCPPCWEIERCDECERFGSDVEAARHVIRRLRELGKLPKGDGRICEDEDCELCWLRVLWPDYEEEDTSGDH